MKNRLLHIYCGDGKGKTTAAIGLAVRAAGTGKQVVAARFLKTDQSGDCSSRSWKWYAGSVCPFFKK